MGAQVSEKSLIHGMNKNGKYLIMLNNLWIGGTHFLYQSKNKNHIKKKCTFPECMDQKQENIYFFEKYKIACRHLYFYIKATYMTKSVNRFLNFSMQPHVMSGILVCAYLLYNDNIFTLHIIKIFSICLKLWISNDAMKSLYFNTIHFQTLLGVRAWDKIICPKKHE